MAVIHLAKDFSCPGSADIVCEAYQGIELSLRQLLPRHTASHRGLRHADAILHSGKNLRVRHGPVALLWRAWTQVGQGSGSISTIVNRVVVVMVDDALPLHQLIPACRAEG
jgi:hypothetical protein